MIGISICKWLYEKNCYAKNIFQKRAMEKNWITDYASWIVLSDPTVDRRFDSDKQHTNDQKLNLSSSSDNNGFRLTYV